MAFDVITPVLMGQGSVGVSLATLYTTPASTRALVKDITLTNTSTTTAISVSVYLIPSGGTAGITNILISNFVIQPNGLFQWTGVQVMNAGGFIQAVASATGVTYNAGGGEAV